MLFIFTDQSNKDHEDGIIINMATGEEIVSKYHVLVYYQCKQNKIGWHKNKTYQKIHNKNIYYFIKMTYFDAT